MSGEKLHKYDLQLCDYVVGNILEHAQPCDLEEEARCKRYANGLREILGSGPLGNYLFAYADPWGESPSRLLLSAREFEHLQYIAGEVGHNCMWRPHVKLHERYVATVGEVREHLTRQASEDWATNCGQYATQLMGGDVRLADGIGIVADWIEDLRNLLRAMGAVEVLPAPEGMSPTPTNPAPAARPSAGRGGMSNPGEIFLDRSSYTITYAGVPYPNIDPVAFQLFEKIYNERGNIVGSKDLHALPGMHSKKLPRELGKLPKPLRGLIRGEGGKGRWFQLPESCP